MLLSRLDNPCRHTFSHLDISIFGTKKKQFWAKTAKTPHIILYQSILNIPNNKTADKTFT